MAGVVGPRDDPPDSNPNVVRASQIVRKPVANREQPELSSVSPLFFYSHGRQEAVSVEEKSEAQDEQTIARSWPISQHLRQKTAMTYWFLIWDTILTLLPIVFIGRSTVEHCHP